MIGYMILRWFKRSFLCRFYYAKSINFLFQSNFWSSSSRSAAFYLKSKNQRGKFSSEKKYYGQPSHFSFSWFAAKSHFLASWVQTPLILSTGSVLFWPQIVAHSWNWVNMLIKFYSKVETILEDSMNSIHYLQWKFKLWTL